MLAEETKYYPNKTLYDQPAWFMELMGIAQQTLKEVRENGD